MLAATERKRWESLDTALVKKVVSAHFLRQLAILEAQEEAYREVTTAPDGVFFAVGPKDSVSEFRKTVLEHQAASDESKRQRAAPRDERFVRRIDPSDGVAHTLPELRAIYAGRGFSPPEIQSYWDTCCLPVYPNDEPPEELILELERAGETFEGLLHFLQRRVRHLYTAEEWERVD